MIPTTLSGRLTCLIATLLLALTFTPHASRLMPHASAQGETYPLVIAAEDCETDPATDPNAVCNPSDGVGIEVRSGLGGTYGTCVLHTEISPNGGTMSACTIEIPFGLEVIVVEDVSSLQPGYVPLENPIHFTAPDSPPDGVQSPDVTFQNVPQETQGGEPGGTEFWPLIVEAVDCDSDPADDPQASCEQNVGAVVWVVGENGEDYGSCQFAPETSSDGDTVSWCEVWVPLGATVVVTEDPSTLPSGYIPLVNPQTVTAGTLLPHEEEPDVTFQNVATRSQDDDGSEGGTPEPPPMPIPGGHTAALFSGSCAALGELVAPLGSTLLPAGDPVGQPTAVFPETGFADVDILLDDLLAEPYAIAVFEGDDLTASPIACGDIGAFPDGSGATSIGLLEVNDSGFSGIAYLATYAGGPHPTSISFELIEH